jgi:Ca2+-binding EF-hand superfamily protein
MRFRNTCFAVALISLFVAIGVAAGDRVPGGTSSEKAVGSISARPPVPLDTKAMNTMLRADRDKDGVLSREELEHYDLGLARRFHEADRDRDGKLTLYEFEKLLKPDTSASR